MDLHLSGKTAVVTGASKGIGLAITGALVNAGAHVVAGARSRGQGLPALEENGQVSFVPVDLSPHRPFHHCGTGRRVGRRSRQRSRRQRHRFRLPHRRRVDQHPLRLPIAAQNLPV